MTTEIQREVNGPEDLAELLAILSPMIGKACWGARLGYGDELTLDIGGRVPRRPRGEKGEWVLRARATPFWIEPPEGATEEEAEKESDVAALLRCIEGATISGVDVQLPDLGLEVRFDHGYTLTLSPDEDGDDEDDDDKYGDEDEETADGGDGEPLSSWELFAPEGRVLEVGPGPVWRCTLPG